MSSTLILGFLIGVSVAAPIGPINLLCIRRTITHGTSLGLVSGLGSATGHVVYSAIPALGLSAFSSILLGHSFWFQMLGALMLAYLGFKTLTSSTLDSSSSAGETGLLAAFASTCLLTLANPMTMLSFAAAFTGLNFTSSQTQPGLFALGVFVGSMLWRTGLCLVTGGLRSKLKPKALGWINRSTGLVLAGFGVLALFRTLSSTRF
jgi:threonine/homoserine/homoserine lactone efflux protein